MSDVTDADTAGAGEAAGQKKGRRNIVMIGAVAGALLLAAGGGAWFLMGSGVGSDAGAETASTEPLFYELPVITVNLNSPSSAPEFLRVSIALEVSDPATLALIEPRMPRVLDVFQVYLRELRRSDLEGSAGVYRLKEELHRRINLAIYPASVDDILFKEILVQ